MSEKQRIVLNNFGKSLGSAGDKLLKRLEAEGYEIVSASDPGRAVEKALEAIPDLFLLNPKKRRSHGIGFLEQLRRKKRLAAVPAVFLTKKASAAEVKLMRSSLHPDGAQHHEVGAFALGETPR